MKKRFLRDLEVSAIGYGCMGLSHGYGTVPERSESIQPIRQLMTWDARSLTQLKAMARGIMNVLQGRP